MLSDGNDNCGSVETCANIRARTPLIPIINMCIHRGRQIGGQTGANYARAADAEGSALHEIERGESGPEQFEPETHDLQMWELDRQIDEASRRLESRNPPGGKADVAGCSIAPSHAMPCGCRSQSADSPRPRKPRPPFMVWAIISLSLAAFSCGAVLVGWAQFVGRPDLWDLGLPLVLSAQAGLLIGLALLLERIWIDSHKATEKIDAMDDRLEDLKMPGTTHATSGPAFYAQLADGASPHLLLADLKSQLDVLAVKIADFER